MKTDSLDSYRLMGLSGLRVSPVALGAMTFGTEWGWGSTEEEARAIFDHYVDRGGNFIDTANSYTEGTSERFIGNFVRGRRDRVVIATKYSLPLQTNQPNSGGNHRRSMILSVEESLRRLGTDYIDLLYLHAWDGTTQVEEVMRSMDDLVRSGKVLYVGVSNIPAWQASRMQATALFRGHSPLIALQIEYSLVERTGDRDLIPMAEETGMGIVAYSPLAAGLLTGKYSARDFVQTGEDSSLAGSRKESLISSGLISQRNLAIVDLIKAIAGETGCSPAQVALAWLFMKPAVTCTVVGARTLRQFQDNLAALEVTLSPAQTSRLDAASAIELGYPHDYLRSLLSGSYMGAAMKLARRKSPTQWANPTKTEGR